jgi:putative transcriptional regulator
MRSILRILVIFVALAAPAPAAESDANAIFLVASPGLLDPNFRETVVLVTHPREGAPWGVIINRPLDHQLSEIFTEIETLKGRKDVLFFGGPVAHERLVFLVRASQPPPRAVEVLRDVYFVADIEWIEELLRRPEPTRGLRVYAGYAGWAAGQLQGEIARGGWRVWPADAATVFDTDPAQIWPELIKRASTKRTLFLQPPHPRILPQPGERGLFATTIGTRGGENQ